MFIAGLEINTFLFKKNAFKSAVFGLLSFLIPQILGTLVIISVFGYSTITAVLTAALFASHTLLSLGIVNKFGIGNSEPVSVAVGATIVCDVAVLGLLAVTADVSRGVDITAAYCVTMFGGWILFIAAILLIIPKIAQKIFWAVSEDGYSQFLFVFASACLISWTAHHLRLESLIGAFFCGLAFCKLIPNASVLMSKINFVGNTLFIPFFLISAGMLIRPKSFAEIGDALILGIVLTVLTIISKTAACLIFGKIFKYSKEAVFMTSGMTFQQAATTIACAVVGLEIGIINEAIFNAAMILILLTCTIGEVAAVFFAEKYAQSLPKKVTGTVLSESKTLVSVPSVANGGNLLDFACLFRTQARKYAISPLTVAGDNRESAAEAETVLGFCMNYASELGEVCHPEMRIANNVTDGILRAAAETKASIVVCPFENYNSRLLDDCYSGLVFAKIVENVAAAKRILAVFMPTSEKNSDITLYLAQIKHLSSQLNAGIAFYLSESQKDKILEKINRFLKSDVKYKVTVKSHWNAIKRELPGDIRADDAVVLLMGTRQKLFRSPAMDRYPLILSDRFKKNNIFAVYPSLSFVASQDEGSLFEDNARSETLQHINLEALDTQDGDFESIIGSISQKTGICAGDIYNILFSSLELYPVELISGVVLIHAHTETVENPRIFVWLSQEKRKISPSETSANVLITVLNPLNGDPQIHLKTLSAIAGIFTNPKCGEIIENAKNCEELVQNLQNP